MADRPLRQGIAGGTHVDVLVRPMNDREELRRMLAPYKHYAAYALGQLQPELFARSEWWLARGATGEALLLHSRGGLGSALFALGAVDELEALLRLHPGPRHTFLTCQVHHLEKIARQYLVVEQHSMLRMLADRETFRPAAGTARRLIGNQVRLMNSLYRSEGTPAFYSEQNIEEAVYYAAFAGDRIVAVAGTHVEAPDDAIAVVGNVFTHPAYRGQGLAKLVTSAVTQHLLKRHREVVLSVDPRNEPAVAAYRRLGFREVSRLIEGAAVRRDLGLTTIVRRRVAALRGRRFGAELVSIRG